MGVNYVIINTPIDKVNLIINLNEFENLTELLNQSKYMLEVHILFH